MPPTVVAYLPLIGNIVPTATWTSTLTSTATAMSTPVPVPTATSSHPGGDTEAPKLVDWSFVPDSVNPSNSDQNITVTARIVDNLSGLADRGYVIAYFLGPSGQNTSVSFRDPQTLIAGTAQDGIHRAKIFLPRFSATGKWEINYIYLVDRAGNDDFLYSRDLSAQGLPFSFQVTN